MVGHSESAHDLLDLDIQTLRQFVELFPNHGLAKVLTGYLCSGISKYPLHLPEHVPDLSEGGVALDQNVALLPEDCLVLMTEGILEVKDSPLAYCLLGDYYLALEEYESAVEVSRKGLKLAASEAKKTDLSFRRVRDALNSTLATALVYYQSPRNHAEAKDLFRSILKRRPQFTSALIGIGLILEEEDEFADAIEFLEQALNQDLSNGRIGAEAAWCQARNGNYKVGMARMQEYLDYPQMDASNVRGRDLRAQTLYRIGVCLWELDTSKAARKNRDGAYSMFLAAIKANPTFAPPYTKLGIFYEDYNKDKKRARQCFQKAFELSPSEIEAAERLARLFANQGDWDIVEAVAQRVVDSGKLRATAGSRRKIVSWPYSALGVVQMNKQEYQKSTLSFLAALRINPEDYHSYVGLGESYHNSGRYNSAARAFNYAESPSDNVSTRKKEGESWFTRYMLANVHRELGEYDAAIAGYDEVLSNKPEEYGVSITLLHTLVEKGWRCIEAGFYGEACDCATKGIGIAVGIVKYKPDAFNVWKAVGDASSLFSWVQEKLAEFPTTAIQQLLRSHSNVELDYDTHKDIDGVGSQDLTALTSSEAEGQQNLRKSLVASILAQKRAIASCANDIHAQAVSWYNLGWTEYRAHVCLEQEGQHEQELSIFLRAAMKCFKRAIELEAGNSEFWNSLGVITTTLNPKVAQHAFVRSLHLNERSVRTWTNLGTLYLLQNDYELAHLAFSRAQSTDPDYALAWIGEGIVALLLGDAKEALSHFTHAFELSDSSPLLTKRQYAVSTFDHLVSSPSISNNITYLIQPLFALHQLSFQTPYDMTYKHLAALYLERVGNHQAAIEALITICETSEQEYETSESDSTLVRFAQAKTDLARNLLATDSYDAAVDEAETALDLLSDIDTSSTSNAIISAENLAKTRLSARLTAGLSQYFRKDLEASIPHFRSALEATDSDPDIICLLAKVLWAKGRANEKDIAREQLLAALEKTELHVGLITLLAAMAVIDEDVDTMEAVRDDLDALRASDAITDEQLAQVGKLIEAIATCTAGSEEELNEAQRSIVLAPWKHSGWADLTDAVGTHSFAATLARETAQRSVAPNGTLDSAGLAKAFGVTGEVRDAQKGVVLAPWAGHTWEALAESVSNVSA